MQHHKTGEKKEPKIHLSLNVTKKIEKVNFEQARLDNPNKTMSEEEHSSRHTTESLHLLVKRDFSTSLPNLNSTANDSKLLESNTKLKSDVKTSASNVTEDNLTAENRTTGS